MLCSVEGMQNAIVCGIHTISLKLKVQIEKAIMSPRIDSDMIACDAETDVVDISQSTCIGALVPRKKMNRSVTFANPIVTEVHYRPRTKQKSKHKLYFTTQEYLMFRREYNAYKEELRRQEEMASSPLYIALSFASNFISGLDVRQREYSSSADGTVTVAVDKSPVSAGDLYDVLYLFWTHIRELKI